MRTNLFNFKKLKKDKIILEEEKYGPFIGFFMRYRMYIMLLLLLLALILIIIGVYYVVMGLNESTKVVTNISTVEVEFENTDEFNSVNMKPITGGEADEIFYNRYGNVGLKEGVILTVREFNSPNGVVTYYSDGSAKIVRNDGSIGRISAFEDSSYGINEDGVVILGAIVKEISIDDTRVLEDNTKIIYYSDYSCEIILPNNVVNLLVRNSDRLIIENNRLIEIIPSGVTKVEKIADNLFITYYENGTIKVEKDSKIYIVRNSEDININGSDITFPNNNEASLLKELSLGDGSKLIYYTDGSAEILKNNESIMVRESKDIIYNKNLVIEITETKYANESFVRETPSKEVVIYLDNGGGLIRNPDGTYEYVYENSDIKYDENGNIKEDTKTIKGKSHRKTPDGTLVIDLEDGNSIIIDENGYRIVDTDDIVYDGDGDIVRVLGDEDNKPNEDSVSENRFVINNSSGNKIKYIIALEVSDNYRDYAPRWLEPRFLRFNIVENTKYLENQTFGDKKLEIGTVLEGGTKIEKETYILYESTIEDGKKADINLGLWLDYTDITNDYQDSVFVGTIKVYSETIEE